MLCRLTGSKLLGVLVAVAPTNAASAGSVAAPFPPSGDEHRPPGSTAPAAGTGGERGESPPKERRGGALLPALWL